MRKTKIIKLICSAFTFSFLIQGGIIYASSTLGTADSLGADNVIGAKGEKTMSQNVKYSIQSTTKEIEYICSPFGGGTYSEKPTVNERYSIKCAVISKDGGIAVPPFKTFSDTPDQGGKRSSDYHGVILHWHPTRHGGYYEATDYFDLSLNLNVYQGSTNMGGDQFGWDGNSNYGFGKDDETVNENLKNLDFGNGTYNGGGGNSDSIYSTTGDYSNKDFTSKDGVFNRAINEGIMSGYGDGQGTDSQGARGFQGYGGIGGTGAYGDGSFSAWGNSYGDNETALNYDYSTNNGVVTNNSSGGTINIGNDGIGGVVNDALSDSNKSFNSAQTDWQNSSGGNDGMTSLDNYFSGAGDGTSADSLGNGLTDDLFGFGQNDFSIEDKAKLKNDGYYDANGNYISTNIDKQSYLDSMYDENGNFLGELNGNEGNYPKGKNGTSDYNDGDSLDNFLAKFGSLMDSTQDFIGSHGNGEFSLMNTLKSMSDSLLGSPTSMSDQEMFDMIKKLLLESGYSIEDLISGKNYDANSAYTEPNSSWDMNRITTLLSNKKVKLEPEEVKVAKEKATQKSSLTNASVSSLPFK